jgi:hypothetical protein
MLDFVMAFFGGGEQCEASTPTPDLTLIVSRHEMSDENNNSNDLIPVGSERFDSFVIHSVNRHS